MSIWDAKWERCQFRLPSNGAGSAGIQGDRDGFHWRSKAEGIRNHLWRNIPGQG